MYCFILRWAYFRLLETQSKPLPVAVVVKFVITCKCNEHTKSCSQWIEYLCCSINPHLCHKQQKMCKFKKKKKRRILQKISHRHGLINTLTFIICMHLPVHVLSARNTWMCFVKHVGHIFYACWAHVLQNVNFSQLLHTYMSSDSGRLYLQIVCTQCVHILYFCSVREVPVEFSI